MIKKDKHKPLTKTQDIIYTSIMITIGAILMAIGFVFFVEYNDIIMGGTGGTAKVINSFFPNFLNVSTIVTILMWGTFILGWIFLGTKFALRTLPATILYPLFIKVAEAIINNPNIMLNGVTLLETMKGLNPIISIIFGGIIYGTGVGMMFMVGGSSGGFDIPASIIHKYFGFKLDYVLFLQDAIVISLSIFKTGLEPALLGIVLTKIMTSTVDRRMVGRLNLLVSIISDKYEEINQMILNTINRGATLVPSIGGYTHENKMQVQAVVDKRELFVLKRKLKEIDPNCFIYICDAHEVLGQGFKSVKGDGQNE